MKKIYEDFFNHQLKKFESIEQKEEYQNFLFMMIGEFCCLTNLKFNDKIFLLVLKDVGEQKFNSYNRYNTPSIAHHVKILYDKRKILERIKNIK